MSFAPQKVQSSGGNEQEQRTTARTGFLGRPKSAKRTKLSSLPKSPSGGVKKPGSYSGAAKIVHNLGETVTTVVMSSDKTLFAAGAMNSKAIVCDATTGQNISEFKVNGAINASAFGSEGADVRLIVGTFTGMIIIFHIHSNREEYSMKFDKGEAIMCMSTSRNSTRLAVGGKSLNIMLYALSLTKDDVGISLLHAFNAQGTGTLSISLNATGDLLAAGGESKIVQLWRIPPAAADIDSLELQPFKIRTASTIHSIALNAEGDALAVGTSDHTELYNVTLDVDPEASQVDTAKTNVFCEPLMILECPAMQGGVAFSDLTQIAIGGNNLVSVYDMETGGMLVKMERDDRVRCIDISDDGEVLLIGGFDKAVMLQQIDRGASLYDFGIDATSSCKSVHLSADSTMLVVGLDSAGQGNVILFDATTAQVVYAHAARACVLVPPRVPHRHGCASLGSACRILVLASTLAA